MAFDPSKMELIAGGGIGPRLWSYKTSETFDSLTTDGYFQSENFGFKGGDLAIVITADKMGTILFHKITDNAAVVVDMNTYTF